MLNKNMEVVGVSQALKKLSSVTSSTPTSLIKQSQIAQIDDERLMDITINPSKEMSEQCSDNFEDKKLATESEFATPKCGWFHFYPHFIQKYMTIQWCLFFLCLAGAVQGTSVTFNILYVSRVVDGTQEALFVNFRVLIM